MEKQDPNSDASEHNAPTVTPVNVNSSGSTISVGAGAPAVPGSAHVNLPDLKDLSVQPQDLMPDKLLLAAPRTTYNSQTVPMLGGIPLLARLGVGGMGAVYYGIHPRLKLEVAVKILPFQLAEQQPELISRFFREAKIAATVESPHLVRVTDVNEECGLYFLVMEYVNGVTAGDYLKQHGRPGLDETVALDICIAATEGLVAAHDEDIIHRDIKPDNIMLPRQRHKLLHSASRASAQSEPIVFTAAKLSDLGLAHGDSGEQSLTAAQTVMGTPGYMAPEQAVDAKTAGKPADVFSMGATLYALLCGAKPYSGGSQMETILATIQKPHSPLKLRRQDISTATHELVDRTLSKSPESRYADAAALLDALRACRAAFGPVESSSRPARKSRDVGSTMIPKTSPPIIATGSSHVTSDATKSAAGVTQDLATAAQAQGTPVPSGQTPGPQVSAPATTPIPVQGATPIPVQNTTPVPASISMPTPTPVSLQIQAQSLRSVVVGVVIIVLLIIGALVAAFRFGMVEEKKIESGGKTPPVSTATATGTATTTDESQQKELPRFREEVLSGQQKMAANDYVGAKTAFSIAKSLAIKKESREFAENGMLAAQKAGFTTKLLEAQTAFAGDHMTDARLAYQAALDLWPESPDAKKATDGLAACEKVISKKRAANALKDAMMAAYAAENEDGRDAAYKKTKWEEALTKAPEGSPEIEKIKARIAHWAEGGK